METDDRRLVVREWGESSEPGVLLWPGLGFTGAYFSLIADALPGRVVAVDPPGWGGSPAAHAGYGDLVDLAVDAFVSHECRAIVGHSIGADLALGLAAAAPPGLKAAVLVDGGFLESAERVKLGAPPCVDREATVAFWRDHEARFPDWATAIREFETMFSIKVTAATEAILRETGQEVDGEVRESASPEVFADMLCAFMTDPVSPQSRAATISVPTLLMVSASSGQDRLVKQRAWERFGSASRLIDVYVAEEWGHHPFLEAPEASGELVGDWLRRHL